MRRIDHPSSQQGYTIFEMVVTVAILAIFTLMVGVGFPAAAHHQRIVSSREQIEDFLRQARDRALYEVRPPECVDSPRVGGDPAFARRCSHVGLALADTQATLFADINGDRQYSASADVVLGQATLTASIGAVGGEERSFVFEATPPTLEFYEGNQPITVTQPPRITLRSGPRQAILELSPYGQVEVVDPGSSNE